MTYEERLRYLDLHTLVYRRSRGDMIETYKIVNGTGPDSEAGVKTNKRFVFTPAPLFKFKDFQDA